MARSVAVSAAEHILQRAYRAELCRPRTVALGSVTVDLQDAAVHRADCWTRRSSSCIRNGFVR